MRRPERDVQDGSGVRGFSEDEHALSPTYLAQAGTISFGRVEVASLVRIALGGAGVARVSLHPSPTGSLHSMLIAQEAGRYWRPKRHLSKSKSFHIVEGSMLVVIFDDDGKVRGDVVLSPEDQLSVFVSPGTFHTNIALSRVAVHHEVIEGPFARGETDRELAPFAPSEEDAEAAEVYISGLMSRPGSHLGSVATRVQSGPRALHD